MGCDIHAFVEYKEKKDNLLGWRPFGGEFHLWRNYTLFGRMAGVRHEEEPHVEPRGLPTDVAYAANYENQIAILNPGDYPDSSFSGHVSPEKAQQWIDRGMSKRTEYGVTNPDWHTHSWLTLSEFKTAAKGCSTEDTKAVIAAMNSLERSGFDTRIVFWFDN